MSARAALSVTNVSCQVGEARLVDDVSFDVAPGEWLSIIGPNGAGKSTLLRSIAGATPCTGRVEALGNSLFDLALRERAQLVSWVPQTPTVPAGMSVLDYVLLGRTPYLHPLGSPSKSDVRAAHDVLEELNLGGLAARTVETLSGGERQRVVIGRALVQDTPVILLDEPTSALDLGHQQDVLVLLDQLRSSGDRTIISTMHDLTLAGHFADRVVLLSNGKVAAAGAANAVLTEDNISAFYGADVVITYQGNTPVISPRMKSKQPPISLPTETSTHEDQP